MSAKREAMTDMTEDMQGDFLIAPTSLDTKETRELNRRLGLSKVNHIGNSRRKKL